MEFIAEYEGFFLKCHENAYIFYGKRRVDAFAQWINHIRHEEL